MPEKKIKLNEGDVYGFRYSEVRSFDPSWCFDGQLVCRKDREGNLYLEDTYWNSNGICFTLEKALKEGKLTFRFNLNEVEETNKDCVLYYDPKDIFNFSHQHGCYVSWRIKKGAKKSKEVMLNSINEKITEAYRKLASVVRDIELLSEKKTKVDGGNLSIYI